MSEKKKTVFERLGDKSGGRHSDGAESKSTDNQPSVCPGGMSWSRKRHADVFDHRPYKRQREARNDAEGRNHPTSRENTTRDDAGSRFHQSKQRPTRPAPGGKASRGRFRGSGVKNFSYAKKQKASGTFYRQTSLPQRDTRCQSVRQPILGRGSSLKKPFERKTQYNVDVRPGCSHWETQERNTGAKRKAEYETRREINPPPSLSTSPSMKTKWRTSSLSYGNGGVFSDTRSSFKGLGQFQKTPLTRKHCGLSLSYMLGLNDEEIAVRLAAEPRSLKKTLDDDEMRDGTVPLVLQMMEKACTGSTHHQSNLKLVLQEVENSVFFKKRVLRWIKETKLSGETQKDVGRICTLCAAIIRHSTNSQASADRVSIIVSKLYIKCQTQLKSDDKTLNEAMLRRIENLNNECDKVQTEAENSLKLLANNQFRMIPILPDIAEIRSDEPPPLKASLKEGAYESVGVYLDTTFRLLREDFVAPLRNGISAFLKQKQTTYSNKRLDDVRVYRGVHILNPVCGYDGISYRVQFSVRGWKTRQLENMRLLCYGSLVLFSSDNFVSGLFGVVANRDFIKQGIINIQFQNPITDPSIYCKEYVMVESIAFFEAYRPVLEGLQNITEHTLPLQDYIVKTSHHVLAPLYLRTVADQKYDLSPLYKHEYRKMSLESLLKIHQSTQCSQAKSTFNKPALLPASLVSPNNKKLCQISHTEGESPGSHTGDLEDNGVKTEESGSTSELKTDDGNVEDKVSSPVSERDSLDIKHVSRQSNPREIDVLNFNDWPDESMVHLDDSQLRAVHAALTQELAVIQGPPGTGKTYVGLKIMEVLLRTCNRDVWSGGESGPILVVCYTNHALDQFLEGVLEFEKNIVRIGGRSQSEKLKGYNLKNSKQKYFCRKNHAQRSCLYFRRHRTRETIQAGVSRALSCQTVIHKAESLMFVMKDQHAKGFCQSRTFGDVSVMCEWLGLHRCILQTYRQEKIHDSIGGMADEGGMADHQRSVFEDTEESRLLDDEIDDRAMQKSRTDRAQILARRGSIDIQSLHNWAVKTKYDSILETLESLKKEMIRSDMMSEVEANSVYDIWRLSYDDKWRLYRYWVDVYRTKCLVETAEDTREYDECTRAINEIDNDDVLHILKRVKVIGMTTTGAAKKQPILQRLGARIVVVEEAAEVMEAHVVAALSEHCQHLILIGDHQQLKPNPAVYRLAKQYNLDISLFERMVNNNYPCQTLSRQHRMRPEISEIMRKHFYPNIQDDDSVLGVEKIRGLAKNMFFINHDHNEDDDSNGMKSHSSEHEANMVVALCKYILQQGYSPSQVTVLTTYKGQLFTIKPKLVRGDCSKVRVSVVDNYQGEECDIIILSLVRSNDEGKIGFLKTSNRVCVMLSRAKVGLYCIGNFDQLSAQSPLWKAITDDLKTKKLIGNSLALACHHHPDVETHVACAGDFKKAPEGGCMRPCTFRLTCGHVCTRLCHPDDPNHDKFKCRKNCEKIVCIEGHKCQKSCFEECTKLCTVLVERLLARCNHSVTMECFNRPELRECKKEVLRTDLPCGHQVKMPCSQALDQCPARCEKLLACGHRCTGSCSSCLGGRLHVSCKSKCGRILVCGHECTQKCSSYCPPCERECENRCNHSQCRNKCGELCAPCQEPCRWRCVHGAGCGMKCGEPCDRDPCNEACSKKIKKCGHPCIGLCREPCPSKCRVCDKDEVVEILFGNEDEDDARFVQLQDCKHVIEVTGLDQWIKQADSIPNVNMEQEDGELTTEAEQSTVSIQLKGCPRCKTPIRRSTRYNREVVKVLSDIEAVKVQVRGGLDRKRQIAQGKSEIESMLGAVHSNFALFTSAKKTGFAPDKVLRDKDPSLHDVNMNLNQTKFAFRLIELKQNLTQMSVKDSKWCEKTLKDIKKVSSRLFNSSRAFRCTKQELIDFPNELHRLYLCCSACSLPQEMHERRDSGLSSELDRVDELLFKDCKPLTPGTEKEVTKLLKKIREGIGALGISEETKIMIVAAMGLTKGHWYKCPNGHVYAIGECGGAMEKSQCPECKADIGGTSHKLTSDNAVATEMDGAEFSAWSEQANMANYDMQDLGL